MTRHSWELLVTALLLCLFASCCSSIVNVGKGVVLTGDTVGIETIGIVANSKLKVNGDIDLHGSTFCLPADITLDLRYGTISNGCIIGNQTKLLCKKGSFNKVKIKGTWCIPVINSDYFKDLLYENSLQDVMALTNPEIANQVVLSPGDYYVTIAKNGDAALIVSSNTTLEVNGIIHLLPNEHRISYIMLVKGNNIAIKGRGKIIGDKMTHLGKTGEWGMGINLDNASHVRITGLTVKNCWGDCIYVGGESQDVQIDNCILDNGRRQGISITSGRDITIRDCKITNVNGTAPQYAIDIEPNEGDDCDNICIDNIEIENCKGGIQVYGRANRAKVGKVTIQHCTLKNMVFVPLRIEKCESLVLENNSIADFKTDNYKLLREIGTAKENLNRIKF